MEHLEAIGKIFAIVGPILLGLLWVLKRIEKGQNQMIRFTHKNPPVITAPAPKIHRDHVAVSEKKPSGNIRII